MSSTRFRVVVQSMNYPNLPCTLTRSFASAGYIIRNHTTRGSSQREGFLSVARRQRPSDGLTSTPNQKVTVKTCKHKQAANSKTLFRNTRGAHLYDRNKNSDICADIYAQGETKISTAKRECSKITEDKKYLAAVSAAAVRNKMTQTKTAYLEVVGTATDTSPGLFLFIDNERYLFNCGEGSQRIFADRASLKIRKIFRAFITSNRWTCIVGSTEYFF